MKNLFRAAIVFAITFTVIGCMATPAVFEESVDGGVCDTDMSKTKCVDAGKRD